MRAIPDKNIRACLAVLYRACALASLTFYSLNLLR